MPAPNAAAATKARGRTAERVLDVSLGLFNRFGEPNVSTALIAQTMGISSGNLHYHYPAKAQIVDALVARHVARLAPLFAAARDVRHVEDAWLVVHMLFEAQAASRFLLRDVNELVSRNREVEQRIGALIADTTAAICDLLDGLTEGGAMRLDPRDAAAVSTTMVVVLTAWLNFDEARDPRHRGDDGAAAATLARGAYHVLSLLLPYLEPGAREHLRGLAAAYR